MACCSAADDVRIMVIRGRMLGGPRGSVLAAPHHRRGVARRAPSRVEPARNVTHPLVELHTRTEAVRRGPDATAGARRPTKNHCGGPARSQRRASGGASDDPPEDHPYQVVTQTGPLGRQPAGSFGLRLGKPPQMVVHRLPVKPVRHTVHLRSCAPPDRPDLLAMFNTRGTEQSR